MLEKEKKKKKPKFEKDEVLRIFKKLHSKNRSMLPEVFGTLQNLDDKDEIDISSLADQNVKKTLRHLYKALELSNQNEIFKVEGSCWESASDGITLTSAVRELLIKKSGIPVEDFESKKEEIPDEEDLGADSDPKESSLVRDDWMAGATGLIVDPSTEIDVAQPPSETLTNEKEIFEAKFNQPSLLSLHQQGTFSKYNQQQKMFMAATKTDEHWGKSALRQQIAKRKYEEAAGKDAWKHFNPEEDLEVVSQHSKKSFQNFVDKSSNLREKFSASKLYTSFM